MLRPRGDALDQLAGGAAERGMIDRRHDIGFFAVRNQKRAVDPALGLVAGHRHRRLLPHRAAAEQADEPVEPRLGAELRRDLAEMHRFASLLDQRDA